MHLRMKPLVLTGLVSALLLGTGAPGFAQDPAKAPVTALNEQTVMALVWMQNAAEYRELMYQAFNLAGMIVDRAVGSAKPGDKALAVISDLDESLLDNSAYNAGLVGREQEFAEATWTQWEKAAQARAMPGAAAFLNRAAGQGVTIFYVTNRDQAGQAGTIQNLKNLGYPFADAAHVLVRAGTSDKQPRFDAIAKDFHVAVYLGDNANDLPIGTYHKSMRDRNALVDQNQEKFGTQFVALPNPAYGDWEGALAEGYYRLPAPQKNQARKAALTTWVALP